MKDIPINKRVGDQLRLLRLSRNLSLEALSDELKISVSTLSNLERGETEMTITRLEVILKYLKMEFTEFFLKLEEVNQNNLAVHTPRETFQNQNTTIEKNILQEIYLLKKEIEALKKNQS